MRTSCPELDWSEKQKSLAEAAAAGNRIRFLVEVDEAGRISSCLPWEGVEAAFDDEMARKIETELRFAPSQHPGRGWLELSW